MRLHRLSSVSPPQATAAASRVPHPLRGASPSSARSFAWESKTHGASSLPECLEHGNVGPESTQRPPAGWGNPAGGRSPGTLSGQCVCVSAWVSLLCPLGLGAVPISAPCLALCSLCHSKGIPIPARDPGTGSVELWCWSWRGWRCHRALALLSPPCPFGCWGRQGCQQGRSTQRSLQAPAAPNPCEEWAAAALDGTCPFVMCPVALPSTRGGTQPGARPPVLAEPALDAWGHLPPQGDGWVWDTRSGTVLCHKAPQERDAGPQTLQRSFLQDLGWKERDQGLAAGFVFSPVPSALHFCLKDLAGPPVHGGRMQCSGGTWERAHMDGTDPSLQSSPGRPGVSSWTAWHWWQQVLAKISPEALWVRGHPPLLWMAPQPCCASPAWTSAPFL